MDILKDLADRLNNTTYGNISKELTQEAKEKGIVIVYGESDDRMELDGAIYDEFDCYEGGTVFIDENGILVEDRDNGNIKSIEAVWGESDYAWTYKTDIPHETFDMYDDDEKYCKGIVFFLNSLNLSDTKVIGTIFDKEGDNG